MSKDSEELHGKDAERFSVRVILLLLDFFIIVAGVLLIWASFLSTESSAGIIFIFPFIILGGRFDPVFLVALAALVFALPLLIFYFFEHRLYHE